MKMLQRLQPQRERQNLVVFLREPKLGAGQIDASIRQIQKVFSKIHLLLLAFALD